MTKQDIRSFVWNELRKVDKTNKYHDNVIDKAITFAFNQGYTDLFDKDPRLLDNYTVSYGSSDSLESELSSDTGRYYATLPAAYVPFNDKASGVRHVFTESYSTTKFYPVTAYELDISANTNWGEIDNRIGYCVLRTTMEFIGMSAAISLRVHMVQPFDAYADTDVINIPFGKDMDLITAVINVLRSTPPVDLKNDNSDESWQTQQQ